jgi:hypothetical protein
MKPLALLALLALPLPAQAETREERVAAARGYITILLEGFDSSSFVASLYQPILDQVAAGGVTLTPDQVEAVRKLYSDTFSDPAGLLMEDQAGLMADVMTLAEIEAIVAFYSTPEGRSVMAKLPQLNAAQQQKMAARIAELTQGLMPQVLAIINGEEPPAPTVQP